MFDSVMKKYKKQGYLLLDELTVTETSNCYLDFCQAVKDPANPILTPTKVWEGHAMNGCKVAFDEEHDQYRMYYGTFERGVDEQGRYSNALCYYRGGVALSNNGLTWEKPATFHTVYHGIQTSYGCRQEEDELGPCGTYGVYDPRPECPPEERYKALHCRRFVGGIQVLCSADGLVWRLRSKEPVWYNCSDIIYTMWDEARKKFVAYFKLWKLIAEVKDEKAENGFRPMTALTVGGWKEEDLGDGTTKISGIFTVLHPESQAERVERTLIVRSGDSSEDDDANSHLSGVWHTRRVVCWAESEDFIHWEHEQEILDVDEWDRPYSNIQEMVVFPMGGYYLALPEIHDVRGYIYLQLAFSQDGIHWKRPCRSSVIGIGAPDQYDCGRACGVSVPMVTENQMIIYYTGMNEGHVKSTDNMRGCIGRATMRKDGFARWKTYGDQIGTLETVALQKKEDVLYLNIDSEAGWLTVALLDECGRVIPGYDHADCETIREDSASHTDCVVPAFWNGKTELPNVEKVKVQLRFQNASVYSVLI